ncbi:hypothetical protein WA026_009869 [Henosepilachna vigintioctopunctata]|uniref:Uncharacterized protein n=1 Tax=Henosepilachna vigintioctopunctata TaxID=420089 RepID=A0AAW1TL46_9CUCU
MVREKNYLKKKRSKRSRCHKIAANKQYCDKFIENILFYIFSSAMDIVETREREFVFDEHVIENGEGLLDNGNYKEIEQIEDNTSAGTLGNINIGNNNVDEYDFTWGSLEDYNEI